MRVLYLSHTSVISGAERSLLALAAGLPAAVEPHLACPPGPLADAARGLGLPVTDVPGTDGSLRLHPVHTPKTLFDLANSTRSVRRLTGALPADLIHANSTRAGLVATAVTRLGGPPAVVHVRDRMPDGAVSDAVLKTLVRGSRVLIANSAYTGERIPAGRAGVRVIPNPVDVESLTGASIDGADSRDRLGLERKDLIVAVVGQITPWKGQDLAVRVTAELSDLARPVRLLIVGSAKFTSPGTRYDNRAFEEHLRRLVSSLGLEERVRFLGEREDVPAILAASDLLLAPSWEEPFGRSVVEAMAMGVPVIATEVGGPAEIIEDGVDGLLLPPRQAGVWSSAARDLLASPEKREKMGRLAREHAAARFGVRRHVDAVVDIYRSVVRE